MNNSTEGPRTSGPEERASAPDAPKPLILEAVTEGKGAQAAENLAALKKGEMAARAAELLTGTGWLPAMLRAA